MACALGLRQATDNYGLGYWACSGQTIAACRLPHTQATDNEVQRHWGIRIHG
jgi:hypothetical protein